MPGMLERPAGRMLQGAGIGAGLGAVGAGGPQGMLSGAQHGALSTAAVLAAQKMFPNKPEAASVFAQGLMMGLSAGAMGVIGIPGIVGGGLELLGLAKGDNTKLWDDPHDD